MTSLSLAETAIKVFFFRDAAAIYGVNGLSRATEDSAGADLRACFTTEESLCIPPGERRPVPSGIAVEPTMPGIAGFVYSRSGLGAVKGLTVAQGVGLIDPDYRGEIIVYLLNTARKPHTIGKGERIAQLVFQPFVRPRFCVSGGLGETDRGGGGFGHTGAE